MHSQLLSIENKEVLVTSNNAQQPFNLHFMDIEFIEDDIINNEASNGSFDVIVNEGLINIDWSINT